MSKLILESTLKKFLNQEKLAGIADFLTFLQTRANIKTFAAFCQNNNVSIDVAGHVLFHGSSSLNPDISPNHSENKHGKEAEALVYATDDSNYAIFLAIIHLKNASAGVVATKKETMLTIDTEFVNGSSKLKPGYVHVLPATSFKKLPNREYMTSDSVPVLFSIKVSPQDLTVPIYVQTS